MDPTTRFEAPRASSSWTKPPILDRHEPCCYGEAWLWEALKKTVIFVIFMIDLKVLDKTLRTATLYSEVTEPPESVLKLWRYNQSLCGPYHRLWSIRNVFIVDHTTRRDGKHGYLCDWFGNGWQNFGNCDFWTTTQASEHQVLKWTGCNFLTPFWLIWKW